MFSPVFGFHILNDASSEPVQIVLPSQGKKCKKSNLCLLLRNKRAQEDSKTKTLLDGKSTEVPSGVKSPQVTLLP
uniref:Uncharacterized protein n=1 Tax=Nelumbo nucifera TaxID=4432 RepID=A0A822YSC9_NELNU|nr:TPA_asm: hypothetical protein HUJ06_005111 [Nelumbo nucifera]